MLQVYRDRDQNTGDILVSVSLSIITQAKSEPNIEDALEITIVIPIHFLYTLLVYTITNSGFFYSGLLLRIAWPTTVHM